MAGRHLEKNPHRPPQGSPEPRVWQALADVFGPTSGGMIMEPTYILRWFITRVILIISYWFENHNICMYIYIYMYACIYVCIYICIYIYMYVYIYMYIYICMYVYIYIYVHTHTLHYIAYIALRYITLH